MKYYNMHTYGVEKDSILNHNNKVVHHVGM